jgi:photosystem II stability/assembly factor-like uncharacterized protein
MKTSGVLVPLIALVLAACGGSEGRVFNAADLPDPGPIHVHALGVDPADGAMLIATHTGLWRLAPNEASAVRVADRYQDTMGFTVAGPGHYFGSGHPDLREARELDLPPHLGFLESRDGGKTWESRALLGEADFHVLRFAGQLVYGYDSSNDRLLMSADRGATWEERVRPGGLAELLLDLVVDPSDTEQVVAASEQGLYASNDSGRSWHQLGRPSGLLAWPARELLYLVDLRGQVSVSGDVGRSWRGVGQVDGAPAALLATEPDELFVALHDGTIMHSGDGGNVWAVRFRP